MDAVLPVIGKAVASVRYASERRTVLPSRRRGPAPLETVRAALEDDLETAHRAARDRLGLKRKELRVEVDAPTAGALKAPAFEYRVAADLAANDPTQVRWYREIVVTVPLESTAAVLAAFADRLDSVLVRFTDELDIEAIVDRLEAVDDSRVRLDYDMRCRWCELTVAGVPARIRLEGREMRVLPNAGSAVAVTELWEWVRRGAWAAAAKPESVS